MAAQPQAQSTTLDELVSAVVRIKTFIDPDGRSVSNLGREREGSGIVIDESGLVLTIGYLMVEAHGAEVVTNAGRTVPATVVGYDHETGFGLLRAIEPLKIKPLAFGKSADVKEKDPSWWRASAAPPWCCRCMWRAAASSRAAGNTWSSGAIFTTPPHPAWSGAALINREGKLVGVGSLIVGDAAGGGSDNTPGNMFVPIDLLMPILGDLLANGRVSGPGKPWLGVNAHEVGGRAAWSAASRRAALRRSPGSSAATSSSASTARPPRRSATSTASSGRSARPASPCRSTCCRAATRRRVDVPSANRLDQLKLKSTF